MKRDKSLIMLILETAEANDTANSATLKTDKFSALQIDYHIELCTEAGFLQDQANHESFGQLTWRGHNALDRLREGCTMKQLDIISTSS